MPKGTICHVIFKGGMERIGPVGRLDKNDKGTGESWIWAPYFPHIVLYRVRKPRGLAILENLIADIPAPVGPKVGA